MIAADLWRIYVTITKIVTKIASLHYAFSLTGSKREDRHLKNEAPKNLKQQVYLLWRHQPRLVSTKEQIYTSFNMQATLTHHMKFIILKPTLARTRIKKRDESSMLES